MDQTDGRILNLLQSGLAPCSRPYLQIAAETGISENEVIRRIKKMKKDGIIRRISAFFHPRELGYQSTLCTLYVPEEELERVVGIINAFPEVTHNYLREDDEYNVWFTVIARGEDGLRETLEKIRDQTRCSVSSLPSLAFYKIKLHFDVEEQI
jgi:DNA-binding Lrp family transcriptional regulator